MSQRIELRATGGPEQLVLVDADPGLPGAGEVRLKHEAIGLNFIDVYQRTGLYKVALPYVPGFEGAGIVTAIGPDVSGVTVGDRVAYWSQPGAYAVERLIRADALIKLPDGISSRQAAAMMLKGFTAYFLLHLSFPLGPGHVALVHAAAGGVGLIMGQWGRSLGARMIGTAGSAEKIELARANGYSDVIAYRDTDFAAAARALTDGQGVDVAYDSIGRDTFTGSLDALRRRGLLVSFGNASGPVSVPDLGVLNAKGSLYVQRPSLFTIFRDKAEEQRAAQALFGAVLSGAVKVHVGQEFALSDVAAAHRALESRATTGSTILIVE